MRTPGASSEQNGVTSPDGEESGTPFVDQEHHEPWVDNWHMKDEFAFLRGLGSWRRRESVPDRAQLLRGYMEGLKLRRRWINLEREALECEAGLLLKDLEAGGMRKSA